MNDSSQYRSNSSFKVKGPSVLSSQIKQPAPYDNELQYQFTQTEPNNHDDISWHSNAVSMGPSVRSQQICPH